MAQAEVEGDRLFYPPVILAVEAKGMEDEKLVVIGKGGRKLYLCWYGLDEIRKLIVLDLSVKGVRVLSSDIEPVQQHPKLEGVFATGPYEVVAQRVDVLEKERRGSRVDGSKLGIRAAIGPVQVDYAGGKTRHVTRTQATVRHADVKQFRADAAAAD